MIRLCSTLLAATLALSLLTPAAALAAQPRVQLTDVEDEVMCTICGTLLELSNSPQAARERALIRRLIARGESKKQIKDALVAEYGQGVLATPRGDDFDLTAWLVPIAAFVAAAVAIVLGVLRWRRRGGRGDPSPEALSPAEADRLEGDIARYDL